LLSSLVAYDAQPAALLQFCVVCAEKAVVGVADFGNGVARKEEEMATMERAFGRRSRRSARFEATFLFTLIQFSSNDFF
jgi:hypothetical protein